MYSSNDPYATDDIECQNISNNNYVKMQSQPTTNTKPNKPLLNTNTTKKKSNTSRILLIAFALILLGIIIGLAVHFGTQSNSTKNDDNSKQLKFDFSVPSYCSVSSPTFSTGLDLAYTTSWKANSKKELGYGFVVVLYPNLKEKKLQAAVHIRGKVSAHAGEIGLPGGHVDNGQETLVDGALRELQEEAMHKTNGLDKKHLQLIYGKKYQNRKTQDCISGLYVLFVNDTKALKGPSNQHKDEMKIDKTQGFDEPSRHKFVSWEIDTATGKVSLSPNQQITSTVWTATLGSLKRVSDSVKCHFPKKYATTAAPIVTTIAPVPNPPASTAQVHPLISITVVPSVTTSKILPSFAKPSFCEIASPRLDHISKVTAAAWQYASNAHQGFGFVVVLYPDINAKKLKAALHIRNAGAGFNQLGLPGGDVDNPGETLRAGALRELKEKAMDKKSASDLIPTENDLHLITVSQTKDQRTGNSITNALYVLFVNDESLLKGPDSKYATEIGIDNAQGFIDPSRHRFLSWNYNATTKDAEISHDNQPKVTSTAWGPALQSLSFVSQIVDCKFS